MQFSKKNAFCKYTLFLISCLTLISYTTPSYAINKKDPLSIWPKAEDGYKKIIIQLPKIQDENLHKVELIPEKTIKVDCNHIMINGTIETKPLTGWGYEYYVLNQIGQPASTMMACNPPTLSNKTIAIQTNLPFLRYNSKLPIVVYIPKNIHLSYRIWSAGALQNTENK